MRLVPRFVWCIDSATPVPVDAKLIELLACIDAQGSLRAAANAVGMPYRTAWGLLQSMEQVFHCPLVRLQRGRGATLTTDGAALLHADSAAKRRLSKQFDAMAFELGAAGSRIRATSVLHISASHDPALAALQDALPAAAGTKLKIVFCGSLDALAQYKAGKTDVAGFHYVPGDTETARPFLRDLRASKDRLLRFVDREQGLIVARGNPHRVRSLVDVVNSKRRFVTARPGPAHACWSTRNSHAMGSTVGTCLATATRSSRTPRLPPPLHRIVPTSGLAWPRRPPNTILVSCPWCASGITWWCDSQCCVRSRLPRCVSPWQAPYSSS